MSPRDTPLPDPSRPELHARFRFPRSCRLRSRRDFQRVYDARMVVSDAILVVRGCANDLKTLRLGLAVSRAHGNAVARNRWKRLIREAFRLTRATLPTGLDIIVSPRRGARPDFREVSRSLGILVTRVARRLHQEPL